jgi:hypothetical protein
MFDMWIERSVRAGPMDAREFPICIAFASSTEYPVSELHVVADDRQAVVYSWCARVAVHVALAWGVRVSGPAMMRVRESRMFS